jgi:hypothetical protein
MTKVQIALLKRLIEADRAYRTEVKLFGAAQDSLRGVKVCARNGVQYRTAEVLTHYGLAEIAMISCEPHVYLGKYRPTDEVRP